MTDNLTVDGNGAGGSPSQPVSKPAIEDADALSKLLDEKLDKVLKPVLGEIRGLQSRQDKSDKTYREFLDEFKKQKASGLNDADAETAATAELEKRKKAEQREVLFDAMARKLGLVPDEPVGNGGGGAVNVAEVVADFGLDPKDPAVIAELLSKSYADEAAALKAARDYKRAKANAPKPTEADRPTSPAAPTPTKLSESEVDRRLWQLNNVYYKNPTKYKKQIATEEKELEEYLPK